MYEKQDLKQLIREGKLAKTGATKRIRYTGKNEDVDVYRIDLKYLYYNDKNGRISTDMSEYKDISGNIENISVDERNDIIEKFIFNSDIKRNEKTKRNIKDIGQQKAGVVLSDGRIIDGNRRYTCLRQLFRETQNAKYSYFEAIVLDGLSDKEIKRLELELQQGEDKPLDYNPIEKLVEIYEYVIKGEFSKQEYANSTNLTMSEVNLRIDKANLMIDFLDYLDKKDKFYLARTMQLDGPLQEIRGIKNKLKDDEEKWAKVRVLLFYNLKISPKEDMGKYIRNDLERIIFSEKFDEFFEKQLPIIDDTKEIMEPDIKIEEPSISNSNSEPVYNNENIEEKNYISENRETEDIEKNLNIAEDIEIEKAKEMEKLRKYRAENEEAQKRSDSLVSSFVDDIKYTSSRRKPIDQINKLVNEIYLIDTYAISKMSIDEKKEITNNIEIIKQKIKEIESKL
jgi:hypothetical protein